VDASGKVTHLAKLTGAATTPPVVTPAGEILAGTDKSAVCLAAH
jgi:hypothetical protein